MSANLLESRGRFWLENDAIPEGHFAPRNSVSGDLTILPNGRSKLNLDSALALNGREGFLGRVFSKSKVDGSICGYLFDGRKYVQLTELLGAGWNFGGGGPIRESYFADRCLVSSEAFATGKLPRFRWLDLPLDGYEDWIGRGRIQVKNGRHSITAVYPREAKFRWDVDGSPLELHQWLEGDGGEDLKSISWRERALLKFGFSQAGLTLDEAIVRASQMEDLLVLLADCNRGLDFFSLRISRNSKPVKVYYTRMGRGNDEEVKWLNSWFNFGDCLDYFGNLSGNWFKICSEFGPGVHLYLGNRRGHSMYAEHRFASLIWGLESLHRLSHIPSSNSKQSKKVQRILDQINSTRDRKWAERFLPLTSEPALPQRLIDLFAKLPLALEKKQLSDFAQRCGKRRNDVSHFGGVREPDGYDDFWNDIVDLSRALDLLYHAILLQLAGVPDLDIERHFMSGRNAYAARAVLSQCGLDLQGAQAG